jgi:DNA-binding NarL/FixJ family response regulator
VSIRLLIVDDQELVRTGFRLFLETQDDLEVIGEAGDGAEAIERATELLPDVVLMDIRMPDVDGVEATARLTAARIEPPPRVLVLTTFDLDEYVFGALRAGAAGFLLKDAPRNQLLEAIRVVHDGEALLSPSITRRLIEDFAARTDPLEPPAARARPAHSPRARGARSRCARPLQRRDREATRGHRSNGQEPRRRRPDEARSPRSSPSRCLRVRARHHSGG